MNKNVSFIRYAIQWTIFIIVILTGYQFYLFVDALQKGLIPHLNRPPSVEGFLPIGALMSLKLWVTEGVFHPVHPAALVIFISALVSATLLKKSFCSWICPVGTFSESLWRIGRAIFKKNFVIMKYLDYPLRSFKYLLMAFFLYVIIVKMTPMQIAEFLDTPYWIVADIKMLKFFTEMSTTTMLTLSILFVLSLLFKNFWCRYLCPYGGLLGLLSIISPAKIQRNVSNCIQCKICSKNCPSLLPVNKKEIIHSPECTGCLTCVSHCPKSDALKIGIIGKKIPPQVYACAVLLIFFSVIMVGKFTNKWHSSVTIDELMSLMPYLHTFKHP